MYTPKHFPSARTWPELLERYGFGLLITSTADALFTTHLPYQVSEDGQRLTLHMARANPHWRAIEGQPRCRFVVQGAHGYVSPTWYETPEAVPTWNYEAVHLDGVAELEFDEAQLWEIVRDLTGRFEAPNGGESWLPDHLPEAFRRPRLRGIVGVRLRVEAGVAKQKLSQNRSPEERRRVARELRSRGQADLANAMEELLP